MMRKDLEQISLKSVPIKVSNQKKGSSAEDTPSVAKSKKQIQVDIKNELGITAGKFGWCIVCRG